MVCVNFGAMVILHAGVHGRGDTLRDSKVELGWQARAQVQLGHEVREFNSGTRFDAFRAGAGRPSGPLHRPPNVRKLDPHTLTIRVLLEYAQGSGTRSCEPAQN